MAGIRRDRGTDSVRYMGGPNRLAPADALKVHHGQMLGPRQVGKTTLARFVAEQGVGEGPASDGSSGRAKRAPGLYLDLENPAHLERLSDAAGYLGSVRDRLVVLDEIHRAPELFRTLRGVIDERIFAGEPTGQFLILGSAACGTAPSWPGAWAWTARPSPATWT